MTTDFWQGKRVFLTGHTGFKGSWLALWLTGLGAEVTGYALPAEEISHFRLADIGAHMHAMEGDIRDQSKLTKAMADARPEIILHLAAQALVRPSYQDPVTTYGTNVMGTLHVLEAARQCGSVAVFINVTSDKCYENREWIYGYRETDPMGGYDPYSASKGCAELIAASYHRSYLSGSDAPFRLASVRAGNVIGGGDWAKDRLIVDCMQALEKDQPIHIRNPHAVRPWQHVLEPLSGYLHLAEKLADGSAKAGEGWNFGPDDRDIQPVQWVVERLCHHWGGNATWTRQAGDHPHEAGLLKLDITKARHHLGWQPRLGLDDALQWTIDWYKTVQAGKPARDISLAQLAAYDKRI